MNPAEHEARNEANRHGVIVGSPEDRIEAAAMADAAGDEPEAWGWWVTVGQGRPA